jgi:hypothetical protein
MMICAICRFEVPLDDVAVLTPRGVCVCLRCYARITETARTVPRWLRQAIETVMAEMA